MGKDLKRNKFLGLLTLFFIITTCIPTIYGPSTNNKFLLNYLLSNINQENVFLSISQTHVWTANGTVICNAGESYFAPKHTTSAVLSVPRRAECPHELKHPACREAKNPQIRAGKGHASPNLNLPNYAASSQE